MHVKHLYVKMRANDLTTNTLSRNKLPHVNYSQYNSRTSKLKCYRNGCVAQEGNLAAILSASRWFVINGWVFCGISAWVSGWGVKYTHLYLLWQHFHQTERGKLYLVVVSCKPVFTYNVSSVNAPHLKKSRACVENICKGEITNCRSSK